MKLPSAPRLDGLRMRILTGQSMAPFMEALAPRLEQATGSSVEVRAVTNHFFGELVTVAGLLAGRDLLKAAGPPGEADLILLPQEALNADDLFIDSLSLSELQAAVSPSRVITGLDLIQALEEV
jgi:NifB/MoaA-like Fe-S oxidoreductase